MNEAATSYFVWLIWNSIRDRQENNDDREFWGLVFLIYVIVCYTFLPTKYVVVSSVALYIATVAAYTYWKNRYGIPEAVKNAS